MKKYKNIAAVGVATILSSLLLTACSGPLALVEEKKDNGGWGYYDGEMEYDYDLETKIIDMYPDKIDSADIEIGQYDSEDYDLNVTVHLIGGKYSQIEDSDVVVSNVISLISENIDEKVDGEVNLSFIYYDDVAGVDLSKFLTNDSKLKEYLNDDVTNPVEELRAGDLRFEDKEDFINGALEIKNSLMMTIEPVDPDNMENDEWPPYTHEGEPVEP